MFYKKPIIDTTMKNYRFKFYGNEKRYVVKVYIKNKKRPIKDFIVIKNLGYNIYTMERKTLFYWSKVQVNTMEIDSLVATTLEIFNFINKKKNIYSQVGKNG